MTISSVAARRLDGGGVYRNYRGAAAPEWHRTWWPRRRASPSRSTPSLVLLRWYREGADLQARMPVLATYLGHTSIEGTQDYLHMTAELYPEIVSRSDAASAMSFHA